MATVLIVDDRAASREIARATLAHGGHRVVEASDGRQGLALARSSHPDAVLTDLLMPGMDGYQFVRELRGDPDTAGTPVLFYTAYYLEDEAHPLAQAFGVSKILSKDASPQELLDAVAEAVDSRVAPSARAGTDFGVQHLDAINAKLLERTRALEESQARFAAVAEALPTGIVIADLQGLASYVSPRLSQMTQTSAAELLGQGWLRWLGRDQRQALCVVSPARLPASLDGQRHREQRTLSDGQQRCLSVLIRPVRDGNHAVTGFVALIDDVTAVVEADEACRGGAGAR
jgi:PAS domain S-box-containing protein